MRVVNGSRIIYIRWMKEVIKLDSKSLPEIFHSEELEDVIPEDISQVYALKEAILKAFSIEGERWLDLKVNIKGKKPVVEFNDKIKEEINFEKIKSMDFSTSEAQEYAMANAVFLLEE